MNTLIYRFIYHKIKWVITCVPELAIVSHLMVTNLVCYVGVHMNDLLSGSLIKKIQLPCKTVAKYLIIWLMKNRNYQIMQIQIKLMLTPTKLINKIICKRNQRIQGRISIITACHTQVKSSGMNSNRWRIWLIRRRMAFSEFTTQP